MIQKDIDKYSITISENGKLISRAGFEISGFELNKKNPFPISFMRVDDWFLGISDVIIIKF